MDWPPDGWTRIPTLDERQPTGPLGQRWRAFKSYLNRRGAIFARLGSGSIVLGVVLGLLLGTFVVGLFLSVWTLTGIFAILNANAGAFVSIAVLFVFYRLVTDPRTDHAGHAVSPDGEAFWIELSHHGLLTRVYRVRVRIDGHHPGSPLDRDESSLYPAPGIDDTPPDTKRAYVHRGEFRKYRNQVASGPAVTTLPVDDGDHRIEFIVDQTNEHYRVEYRAADGEIVSGSVEYVGRYGGTQLFDVWRSIRRGRIDLIPVLRDWLPVGSSRDGRG
jgi:hypothetical protein